MKRLHEEVSFCGLFGLLFCALFLGGMVYKRDGNDMREVEMI